MVSRPARAVLVGLLGATCALRALLTPCFADERPRISVIAGARGAMAHRLSQELEAAGLSVRVEANEADAAPGSLVVVVPAGDGGPIEIWSSAGGRSQVVARVAPEGTLDTRVLRATELVRALALRAPPPGPVAPARPEPAPAPPASTATTPQLAPSTPPASTAPQLAPSTPPASTATAPQSPPSTPPAYPITPPRPAPSGPPISAWAPAPPPLLPPGAKANAFFDIGVAIALGVQAPGPSMAFDASLHIWPHSRVGVGLFAELPLVGATTSATEGSATFRPVLFGVELATAPVARNGRLGLVLAPGVGFTHVSVSGAATPPYVDSDASAFAALVYGRSELRLRLADSVRLTAGVLGGAALPPVGVRFAGREISVFRGLGSFSLGIVIER
ncbi:MAG: hypothetical protein QM820_17285 [Minicystis sp.]